MAVINITKENFAQEVLHSEKPVLLDFWASWCGPCRMLSPVVDEVAEERTDVKVGKVNVDEQPDLAAEFVAAAKAAGLENLTGHRTVGGMRASIYNAMPTEGVEKLCDFIKKFDSEN
mgnify:CR=1 FL=1